MQTEPNSDQLPPSLDPDPGRWQAWREARLAGTASMRDPLVEIPDLENPDPDALAALRARLQTCNMALFRLQGEAARDKDSIVRLGALLGLKTLDRNLYADKDAVSAIEVRKGSRQGEYIPYTDRPLSWHTDGYYNAFENQVRAWALLCAQPAASGGVNQLLDPEIALIRLRDENPAFIKALMQPDAFTIPANIENGVEIRPAQTHAVFTADPLTGALHMRYSARKRQIEWKDDPVLRDALDCLTEVLATDPLRLEWKLKAGEGVVSNNVLHNRSVFENDENAPRLVYRGRFYERIAHT